MHYGKRYVKCYLRAMEALPEKELAQFIKGEHGIRLLKVLRTRSDVFIETTFIR